MWSRHSRQKRKDAFDHAEEFGLSARRQSILLAALDLERALIRFGTSLPVGGSLLVVARRQR